MLRSVAAVVLSSCIASLAAPSASAAGSVHVVDGLSIQFHVDNAAEGDILLIKEGAYQSFGVFGKSLTLVGEAGATVGPALPNIPITIANLAAHQSVVLRNIRITAVRLENNLGPVWIEDCDLTAGTVLAPSLDVVSCAQVAVFRSTLLGKSGFPPLAPSTPGLRVVDSHVLLDHCSTTGGPGDLFIASIPPSDGAAGVVVQSGTVLIAGGSVTGGTGGDDDYAPVCHDGGDGGVGIGVAGAGAHVVLLDVAVSGGAGGTADCVGNLPGNPGAATQVVAGSLVSLPGTSRSFELTAPVREGQLLTFDLQGVAGETPLLLVSTAQQHQFQFFLSGAFLLGPSFNVLALAPLPAGGQLSFQAVVPPLPAGLAGAELYFQTAYCNGPCVLGPGSAAVLLDAAVP